MKNNCFPKQKEKVVTRVALIHNVTNFCDAWLREVSWILISLFTLFFAICS